MPTILITGGTGMIGSALTSLLTQKGYDIIILSRSNHQSSDPRVSYAVWDVEKQTIDKSAVANADYIIHLAGAGIADKRWSDSRKKAIIESRTQSSALLVKALSENENNVKAVISASGIGWYGDDKDRDTKKKAFTEDMPSDSSFLGETCRQWEESIEPVISLGKRLVKFRNGMVLSNDGGAFPEFKMPVKFGVASFLGNGKQVVSWIHIADICRLYLFAIENEELRGVYNAVAPSPVTNKELMTTLAKEMKGSFYVPLYVPSFVLQVLFGEVSVEVLKSSTVSAEKIQHAGFSFEYGNIEKALGELVK